MGYNHTEEANKKISDSKRGKLHSPHTLQEFKEYWTEEQRKLKSEAMKGIIVSYLTKQKMRESWTPERRKAKSEAMSKLKASEVTKQKLRDLWTEETRKVRSNALGSTIFVYSSLAALVLVDTFPSSRTAANHLNCNYITILRYAKSRYVFREEFILSLELLKPDFEPPVRKIDSTVFLFRSKDLLLDYFPTLNAAANHFDCGISTVWRYIRSGKVFKKNIFYLWSNILSWIQVNSLS